MISSGLESSAVGTAVWVVRARLIMVVGGLLAVVVSASLLAVAASARAQSRNAIDEELRPAGAMFVAELETRTRQLVAATRALGGDIALRAAVAGVDQDRARAILDGHRDATGADVVMLVAPQGTMAADTLRPARLGAAFALSPILSWTAACIASPSCPWPRRRRARGSARASRSTIDALPTCGGAPGFKLGSSRVDSGFVVHASTLAGVERDDLKRAVAASRTAVVIRADGSLLAQAKIDHLSGNRWSGRHPFGQSFTGPILSRESVTL